jgi:hypothetical protein
MQLAYAAFKVPFMQTHDSLGVYILNQIVPVIYKNRLALIVVKIIITNAKSQHGLAYIECHR